MDIRSTMVSKFKPVLATKITLKESAGRFTEQSILSHSAKTPAVLVGVLSQKVAQHPDTGELGRGYQLVAYVITTDGQLDSRDAKALDIVDTIENTLADDNNLNPTTINAQNLYSISVGSKNVAFWSVTWSYWQAFIDAGKTLKSPSVQSFDHAQTSALQQPITYTR